MVGSDHDLGYPPYRGKAASPEGLTRPIRWKGEKPLPLTLWQRFLAWLRRPRYWG